MSFPHQDIKIAAKDGLQLNTRIYNVPEGTPLKAKILYIHGFSEHVASYQHWFPSIAAAGYEVTFFDQRGFGYTARSPKEFGVTNEALVFSDIDYVVRARFSDYKGPLLLWGHSMGGGITLNYMVIGTYRDRFDGFLANSPCITTHPRVTDWKAMLLPFLNRFLPFIRAPLAIDAALCTNDPQRIAEYPKDPLRHNISGATLGYGMVTRGKRLLDPEFTKNIVDRPLLVSHGTADWLCLYDSSVQFLDQVKLSDKTLKTYPDWLHELPHLKKEDSDVHMKDVLEWLGAHQEAFEKSAKVAPGVERERSRL